jgi:glycosyltransferase involved in cell wall biosynthesis
MAIPTKQDRRIMHSEIQSAPQSALRVVFVNRYYYPDESATAQLLTDLAIGLSAGGIEVHIVCSRQLYENPIARLAAREDARGVVIHRVWTTRFGRRRLLGRALDYTSFYITSAAALIRLLRRTDIVVAKTDPPLISIVAAAAARLKGAFLINWLQDIFPEVASQLGVMPLPAILGRFLRTLRDTSLRVAKANVVLGSRMLEYLGTRGVPKSKCKIIENSADPDLIRAKSIRDSSLRSRLGLTDKFVIGYSGNLGRAHEYDTILGAAEALQSDPRFVFLFIGAGANMAALQSEAELRGMPNLRFLPYQPRAELEDSLAAADLHLVSLIPSLEGLIVPSKFYGILAAGRAVLFIGDRDGELSRVIRAAHCGLVIAPGNSEALAEAIRTLEGDRDQLAAMGLAARALLCSCFSTKLALASWRTLLTEVADRATAAV